MNTVLAADALSVHRGGRCVLDDLSFSVGKGEVFALLGGNGAGKSTTLLTFLGFLTPSAGTATVAGVPVLTDVGAVHRQTAYLPESAQLYAHLTALENLDYFLALAQMDRAAERVEAALDRVRLDPESWRRRLEGYSKGMRQKVAIALAILRDVPILLLDEPTSGLDPAAIDEFNELVIEMAGQGTTILMVSHDVYGACHVASRIALLHQGRLVGEFEAGADGISAEAVHRAFSDQHRRGAA